MKKDAPVRRGWISDRVLKQVVKAGMLKEVWVQPLHSVEMLTLKLQVHANYL